MPTATPSLPEIVMSAVSAARMASHTPPSKSNRPGESSRLILWFFHSKGATEVATDVLRRISSGSKSQTVVPSPTFPSRAAAPERYSMASARLVFPAPPWPASAMFRIRSAGYSFMENSSFQG